MVLRSSIKCLAAYGMSEVRVAAMSEEERMLNTELGSQGTEICQDLVLHQKEEDNGNGG